MKMTLQEPSEIKIFILFLLEKIGYPLSFSELGNIVIRDGIVDYFSYFEYFSELVEAGHIARADENGRAVLSEQRRPKNEADEADFSGGGARAPRGNVRRAGSSENFDIFSGSEYGAVPEKKPDDRGRSGSRTLGPADYIYPRPTAEEIGDPRVKYVVTGTGLLIAQALSEDVLMAAVREKSYMSAIRHLSLDKRGAVTDQTFVNDGGGYIFKCSIKDRDGMAMELSLRADTVYQLNRMRLNFDEKPDVIFKGIISLLTGNMDYLFDETERHDETL